MLSTVAPKPNHYERLGLEPDAGDEEIERAFAREMSVLRPHSVADMTQIAIAFKTLRDPALRREYDESIAPPPEPAPAPLAKPAMFPREGWPFTASARIGSADLPSIDSIARGSRAPSAEPFAASPPPRSDRGPDGRTPEPPANIRAQSAASHPFERSQAIHEYLREDDDGTGRGRTAVTLGALFAGVALLGAGLGVYASRGIDPAQAQDVATVTLPTESPPSAPDQFTAKGAEKAREPKPVPTRAAAKHRRIVSAPELAVVEEQKADIGLDPVPEPAAAALDAALVSAAMPLPNAVVARTIDRIGYSCGEVASTSSVDGAGGVFKVTCTSGNAFKATPVRGRYHFRRWGG